MSFPEKWMHNDCSTRRWSIGARSSSIRIFTVSHFHHIAGKLNEFRFDSKKCHVKLHKVDFPDSLCDVCRLRVARTLILTHTYHTSQNIPRNFCCCRCCLISLPLIPTSANLHTQKVFREKVKRIWRSQVQPLWQLCFCRLPLEARSNLLVHHVIWLWDLPLERFRWLPSPQQTPKHRHVLAQMTSFQNLSPRNHFVAPFWPMWKENWCVSTKRWGRALLLLSSYVI